MPVARRDFDNRMPRNRRVALENHGLTAGRFYPLDELHL